MSIPRTRAELCTLIDHTLLTPETTPAQCQAFLREALHLGVTRVCLSPSLILSAQGFLRAEPGGSAIMLVSVAGFPSGAHSTEVKCFEIEQLVSLAVPEIDVVADFGRIVAEDWNFVEREFRALRSVSEGVELKIILESACLSIAQLTRACELARDCGADFVKTSTGFHPSGGASREAVQQMAATVGGQLGIKASGGIRSAQFARDLLDAGATRLGLSQTASVLDEWDALFGSRPVEGDTQ